MHRGTRTMRKMFFFRSILGAVIVLIILSSAKTSLSQTISPATQTRQTTTVIQNELQKEESFFKNLYDKNKTAIVLIRVKVDPAPAEQEQEQENFLNPRNKSKESPLKPFYYPIFKQTQKQNEKIQSNHIGTGFIITADGEILTNYHVIRDYKEITVFLSDKRNFNAKLLGYDEKNDIALLKIDGGDAIFPTMEPGDSDSVQEANNIVVIGHPFGLPWSLSLGTVSGLKRQTPLHPLPLIQIQSSINPGNSGSPAITARDNKVIGIIQAKVDDIGFAIPINLVKSLLPKLRGQKTDEIKNDEQ